MSGAVPVAVIMGSQSDWPTMRHAVAVLRELDIACDTRIVSAHRTPERLVAFAGGAAPDEGLPHRSRPCFRERLVGGGTQRVGRERRVQAGAPEQ